MICRIVIATAVAGACLGFALTAAAYEYGPVYPTCTAAHNAGVYDIPQDDPAYWLDGDSDGDGVARESTSYNN